MIYTGKVKNGKRKENQINPDGEIDISHLKTGIYFVRGTSNESSSVVKLIINEKDMKKLITLFFILAIAITSSIFFMHPRRNNQIFTLEWHKITLQNYESMKPMFESLQVIFVETFLHLTKPRAYKHNLRLANVSTAQRQDVEEKVNKYISALLQTKWNKKIKAYL